jgi:hypothetical protein
MRLILAHSRKLNHCPNQSLDLTVKTPVDSVNVLRTAGQAERWADRKYEIYIHTNSSLGISRM